MFAIALASASLLTTVGMIVPMDSFAPVTGRPGELPERGPGLPLSGRPALARPNGMKP
jgi:Na+/H+-translocating membrane pyrophosphatase